MVKSCSAFGCNNRFAKDSGIHFFLYPFKRPNILKQWVHAVRRKNFVPTRHSYLCSDHFTTQAFTVNPGSGRKYLKENAVPSVFKSFSDHYRSEEKKVRKGGTEIDLTSDHVQTLQDDDVPEVTGTNEVERKETSAEYELEDPLSSAKDATLIREAQSDIGPLDILTCGKCHEVFHVVKEFNTHKSNKCSDSDVIKSLNDDTAQAWAFYLWKNKEIRSQPLDESVVVWPLYQKWCQLTHQTKKSWIICGQTLLSLNQISIAKLQELKFALNREEEKDSLALIDNDDVHGLDEEELLEITSAVPGGNTLSNKQAVPIPLKSVEVESKKESTKEIILMDQLEEYVVESILGKRFNAKKKLWEYKVKWENWDEPLYSWEPTEHLSKCTGLIQKFEERLRIQKEGMKAPEPPKGNFNIDQKNDDDSTDEKSSRLPQRSNKQKVLSRLQKWLDEESENEDSNKRLHEDDDSDQSFDKKIKLQEDLDENHEDEEEENPKKTPIVKSLSNLLTGKNIPHNLHIPDAQGIVRISQKELPLLSSDIYIMSKTSGIIKLDSQISKIATSGGQAVVKIAPRIDKTLIKIVKKDDDPTTRVIYTSPSKSKLLVSGKTLECSFTPKVIKVAKHASSSTSKVLNHDQKEKITVAQKGMGLLSSVDEDSDSDLSELEFPSDIASLEFPSDIAFPESEDQQSEFMLDPMTGKIAGVEYPDPELERSTQENAKSSLDDMVKLATEDIAEANLKLNLSEQMDTDQSHERDISVHEVQYNMMVMEEIKELIHKDDTIKMKKDHATATRVQQKDMITPTMKTALKSPRTVVKSPKGYRRQTYTTKSSEDVLNGTMTSELDSSMGNKARTGSKYHDNFVRETYPKPSVRKRVGNIGNTTIYKRSSPPPTLTLSPKVVQKSNVVRKPADVVRPVAQKTPRPVISMPYSFDDDLPEQPVTTNMQINLEAMPEISDELIHTTEAGTPETILSDFTFNDEEELLFITGDDDIVYQVAGQNEHGQTILITQGPDNQQECLLVTSGTIG